MEIREKIRLENGTFLSREFGKYRPNLIMVWRDTENSNNIRDYSDYKNYVIESDNARRFFSCNYLEIYTGIYRKNKKGNDVFELKEEKNAEDYLLCCSWGGAFSSTTGECKIPDKFDFRYQRRASSNGGGRGFSYFIVNKEDFKKALSSLTEDDF